MTQQNSANDPEPSRFPPKPAGDGSLAAPPRAKRKSGWLRKVFSALFVVILFLLILVAMIPTLLGTGAARSFAVSKINDNLNGHVAIADWSPGWTSGIRIDGVKVFDDANRQILEIPHFSTKLSLVGAIRGQIHLGKTELTGLNFFAEQYPDGSLNFAKLAKPSGKTESSGPRSEDGANRPQIKAVEGPRTASKPPTVDGELQLSNCRGTFQIDSTDSQTHRPRQEALQIVSIDGMVKVPGIDAFQFDKLAVKLDGGSITVNGGVADLTRERNLQNLTIDLGYNAAKLWKEVFPILSADAQARLKDTQLVGSYSKRITLGGSYPAGMDYRQAIRHLTVAGEIQLDSYNGQGITMKNFVFPFSLADGKLSFTYADKPAGQNLAAPADLNGGKLSLAGLTADIAEPHVMVSIPPATRLLDKVSLNNILASNIGDYVNNPLLIDADTATGLLTLVINTCDRVPTDDTLNDQTPANDGVLDITMSASRIQLGNPTLSKILAALPIGGKKGSMSSLQGSLDSLHVHIAGGITSEEMVITLGEHKRPIRLEGKVIMKTRMIDMTLFLPLSSFGAKSLPGVGDEIKIPLSGPANKPKFDVKQAIKKNLGIDADDLLKGFFKKSDKSNDDGADGDQPKKDDPIGDILGKFKKKKKPDPDQ